ncbi:MAG: hypothetical protein QOF05_13 [Sphingomonadales bacterium]|nr:hypothetical protein [Sphingomonadales bacterium]
MSYWMYGAGAAVVLVAAVSIGGTADNWQPVKATISTIDRKCQIIETKYDQDYRAKESSTHTGDCNSVGEWEKVRAKHDRTIAGNAVVHLQYTAPQNGQDEMGDLRFTPRDDEFFELKAGDEIKILVSKSNPAKIRKA